MALYYLKADRLGLGAASPPPTRGVMSDWLTAMDAAPARKAVKRVRRPNDPATARQWALLDALCREKHLAPPAAVSTREEVDRWIQEATSDRWRYAS